MINLLSWHGTILRCERPTGRRIHAMPWPVRDICDDLALDTATEHLPASLTLPGTPQLPVWASMQGRAITLRHEETYLGVDVNSGEASFRRRMVTAWERFLPLAPDELAALRDLLGHGWLIEETGERIPPGEARLAEGFILVMGQSRMPLQSAVPHVHEDGAMRVALAADGTVLHLRRGPPAGTPREMALTNPAPQPPPVDSAAAFRAAPQASLRLTGATEYGFLPLTAKSSDQDWMYGKYAGPAGPLAGPYRASCRLVRERDKFILLTRQKEGMLFNAEGTSNERGYAYSTIVTDRGLFTREGDTVFIDQAALEAAPRLRGPHVTIVNGNASNYYHWTIDGLLPLFIMRPYLPADVTLVMPATLRDLSATPGQVDHMAVLRAWGMDDMNIVVVPPPVCHVEEIFWFDHKTPRDFPAAVLHAARAAVLARLPEAGAKRRLYIPRRGIRKVTNEAAVEHALGQFGFESILMETHTPAEQIGLFRDAEMIVGAHGAGLTNIMFCAPGARVLEFMPEFEYRSFYADISDKLGHVHAVLPCPTSDSAFQGDMTVDIGALRNLLGQLQAWRTG